MTAKPATPRPDGRHARLRRHVRPWTIDRTVGLVLVVLVAGTYLLTASTTVAQNRDTRSAAQGAWSLGTRGTLALPDAWSEVDVDWAATGHDGALHVNRFPGVLFWGAPFYAVAERIDPSTTAEQHPLLIDYRPAAVAAVAATTLAVLCSYLVFLRLVPWPLAAGGAGMLAFATSTWSISGNALWTHGLTHLFLAATLLLLASDRAWASGATLGLSILTRPQTAIVAFVLGVGRAARHRRAADLLRVGVPSLLGLGLAIAYSYLYFRNPLPTAGYNDYAVHNLTEASVDGVLLGVWGSLVDPSRGLLLHAPFLVVLAFGLRPAWRTAPEWVRSAAIAGIAYQLLQLRLNGFDGGFFFFSYRLQLELLVLGSPLLLLAFREFVIGRRWRERIFALTAAIAVSLQIVAVTYESVTEIHRADMEPRLARICAQQEPTCDAAEILP